MIRRRGPWPRLVCLTVLVLVLSGCTLVEVKLRPETEPLEERVISGRGRDKVLLLNISGVLTRWAKARTLDLFPSEDNLLSRLTEALDKARKDDRIKAIIVQVDSPGGSVAVSDAVYHELVRFKRETGVKMVCLLMEVAASGGYYVALAGDEILALPTSLTGSIGVIVLRFNLAGLLAKIGVKAEPTVSGEHKDMWSPFRPASEEEERITKAIVDDYFKRFTGLVRQSRKGLDPERLDRVFSGRVFSADQALELGLIDGLAYPDQALARAKELAGLDEAKLVAYQRPDDYRPNVYSGGPGVTASTEIDLLMNSSGLNFMYLWRPGSR